MDLPVRDLYMVAFEAAGAADQAIEFWIAISFAVAIVSYVSAHRLHRPVRVFIGVLYIALSAILHARFYDSAVILRASFSAIEKAGSQYAVPIYAPWIDAVFLNQAVIIVGSLAVFLSLCFPTLLRRH